MFLIQHVFLRACFDYIRDGKGHVSSYMCHRLVLTVRIHWCGRREGEGGWCVSIEYGGWDTVDRWLNKDRTRVLWRSAARRKRWEWDEVHGVRVGSRWRLVGWSFTVNFRGEFGQSFALRQSPAETVGVTRRSLERGSYREPTARPVVEWEGLIARHVCVSDARVASLGYVTADDQVVGYWKYLLRWYYRTAKERLRASKWFELIPPRVFYAQFLADRPFFVFGLIYLFLWLYRLSVNSLQ